MKKILFLLLFVATTVLAQEPLKIQVIVKKGEGAFSIVQRAYDNHNKSCDKPKKKITWKEVDAFIKDYEEKKKSSIMYVQPGEVVIVPVLR